MTIDFLNSENKRGFPIALLLNFIAVPETNAILTLAGNPSLSAPAQALVIPNLSNAELRLKFFNSSDRSKTLTAIPLLTVASLTDVLNTSSQRAAIAVVTGSQSVLWRLGEIWVEAAIKPTGGEWISTPVYCGSFILVA